MHQYFFLSRTYNDIKVLLIPGSGYLLLNGIYSINCCGRIKMWEFVPVNTGRVTFVIMRKTTDNKYKFVGSNQIHISGKTSCYVENKMFIMVIEVCLK